MRLLAAVKECEFSFRCALVVRRIAPFPLQTTNWIEPLDEADADSRIEIQPSSGLELLEPPR